MTSDDTPKARARPVRADVRRNRARLLAAAREAFQRDGAGASLEGVARLAGVGIGTLYRHFPTRQDLLEAVLADVYDRLAAEARGLLASPAPGEALMTWLRTFIAEVTAFPGMAASAMVALRGEGPEPSPSRRAMHEAGGALFARAQRAGDAPAGVPFTDVLRLAGAIAAVTEREPEAAGRLLSLAATGVAPGKGR
ncbi:TetR/AcrR family transcriptional regulator [Actinomadura madurae]|uniref:TetR/AcrR family transcriptional regulator n=1 Tax=Actinomadura madurae TaxID=1993 RepID=UPI002026A353|nr:TetR/AcrR family transcriptional regulator [Actinomadura madurae]MCP9964279.1 TetR/AcrR family transcriptional regulator [Actinomadura madurae]MCP9976762.1 TetR/AcrR family transcriptional regulator [Actinomadura madurae]URM93178.1 TetR/AcrR family transcriptional regulator [Actinomadura madurae]URN03901.1 TetR/AcrR family transcriptional regulator [Actinomadura madurae]